jgi:hypothetical protein
MQATSDPVAMNSAKRRHWATLLMFGFSALPALLPGLALASPITLTYDVVVNNIRDDTAHDLTPPADPVIGSFTVTFDPALGVIVNQTTGISVNNLNLSVGSPIAFSYSAANTDELQIGGLNQGTGGLTEGVNDFLIDIFDASGATPFFGNLEYTIFATSIPTGQFSSFGPASRADGIVTVESTATPLPAALPLFATGLAALGMFGWRRKRKSAPDTA